jgi:hypothetical protein
MSDLAPFVAAVLRDKVVLDQIEELHELRQQLSRARRVTIHGSSGILAEAQFENGYSLDPTKWNVDFPENSCAVQNLRLAEMKVGGLAHTDLFTSAYEAFPEAYDPATMRMEVTAYYSGLCVTFECGPVHQGLFDTMMQIDPEESLGDMVSLLANRSPPVNLYWKSVVFNSGSAKDAVLDISSS